MSSPPCQLVVRRNPPPLVFGAIGEDCTENVAALGESVAPPHTASWKDRNSCCVFGLPCAGRSSYYSQLGVTVGNPNAGRLSWVGTEALLGLNGVSEWPLNTFS